MTATSVPPTIAISELTATRPEILSSVCALITLKPNQPIASTQAPSARNGMLDGEAVVPHHAFEQGVREPDDDSRGDHLRLEARALRDSPRDDGRHRGGEG